MWNISNPLFKLVFRHNWFYKKLAWSNGKRGENEIVIKMLIPLSSFSKISVLLVRSYRGCLLVFFQSYLSRIDLESQKHVFFWSFFSRLSETHSHWYITFFFSNSLWFPLLQMWCYCSIEWTDCIQIMLA